MIALFCGSRDWTDREMIAEDMAMGESIQAGLRSGANELVRLARYEQGLRYFRDELDAYLAGT